MKRKYDLVIVGGGMVGLSLAALLKKSSLKVALIDPNPVQLSFVEGEHDLRVSAITRASENIFREVGAWKRIDENQKSPYQQMQVWDGQSSNGLIEFNSALIGQENIGHIIENRVLRKSLYQAIESSENIDWLCPERCEAVEYHDDFANLTLHSGLKLQAKLLVAADGAFSWLRQASNVELSSKSYQHSAIVCTLKTEKTHAKTAYQRFDTAGPLAFLPLKDPNTCSIVWSLETEQAKTMLSLDEETFCQRLEDYFEHRLGKVELISKRVSFPLYERSADSIIAPRLALIGDAAHTIHPLAGQGVNLGFSDALELARLLQQKQAKNLDIGAYANLRPYARARKGDIWLMQQAMMGLKKLFASEIPAVQMARSQGLNLLQQHTLIKQKMIQKAMGI